jgi:hypothetical protein
MSRPPFRERPTGSKHTIDGVVFYGWHIGILRYEWRTEDGRLKVGSNGSHRSTFWASVDGEVIGSSRFLGDRNAAKAAIKEMHRKDRVTAPRPWPKERLDENGRRDKKPGAQGFPGSGPSKRKVTKL